jgi:hypothetical protein
MNRTQLREKLWSIVAKKKTKSDFFATSAIVNELESLLEYERTQGIADAIECLQISSQYDPAITEIRKQFAKAGV